MLEKFIGIMKDSLSTGYLKVPHFTKNGLVGWVISFFVDRSLQIKQSKYKYVALSHIFHIGRFRTEKVVKTLPG